jgi:prolyl-tRNA editing enzyme YbaK/EbsC (Cys-tRNA(Pro) deacylase)
VSVTDWPEGVERVAAYLRAAGAEARIEEFEQPTPTADDAARAVGCSLAQIVKSLVFDCDGAAVVVLVPGDARASSRKVRGIVGCKRARIAGAEYVEQVTGFTPGAVAPFPLLRVSRVLLDRLLLRHSTVWVGGGSERHLVAVSPPELMRLAHADAVDAAG